MLKNLSLTRWTARAESLRALWISYEAVIEVLRKISNDDLILLTRKEKLLPLVCLLKFSGSTLWSV